VNDEPAAAFVDEGGWRRLHPLSPIARIGRLVPAIVLGFVVSSVHGGSDRGSSEVIYLVAVSVLSAVLGLVHWLVTKWKIEGDTLRIETGLIRRESRQLPLARIQAVDVVRPLMARVLGVSELRVRLAGSGSTDGRLAYLSEDAALRLRETLLSGHRQQGPAGAVTGEHAMSSVQTGRLVASVLCSGLGVVLFGFLVTLAVLADLAPKAAAAAAGFGAVYLLGMATGVWRRISSDYHFEAVEAPEGVRIRRGLLATVSETVPFGRIQAVRQIEPLLWRPMGWCRLEVDIAGAGARNQRGEGGGVARKALLPVGTRQDAHILVDRLIGGELPALTPPPRRARYKTPLSYHFLAAGHSATRAVCVTGRLRKVTAWIPLEKAQSVRRTQGPVQRRLGLASVHVDVAGRRVEAEFRDRSVEEADDLLEQLAELSRAARAQVPDPPAVRAPAGLDAVPPGWYRDPSGRHELRYWSEGRWSEHVSTNGVTSVDPPVPTDSP
jgi:putative membrane protein